MKKLFLGVLVAVALQGCNTTEEQTAKAPVIPTVKSFAIGDYTSIGSYDFPATVIPKQEIELVFERSGRLIVANLQEGQFFQKGDLLAQIKSDSYERAVEQAEIQKEQAKRDLSRVQKLLKSKGASRSEYDKAKTAYELATIALENAKESLEYTSVYAPFDGVVSKRIVDSGSLVNSGKAIAHLQDTSDLRLSINVPEKLMSNGANSNMLFTATFPSDPQSSFALSYVEHETTPDSVSQTYNVTFSVGAEAGQKLVGTTATVKVGSNKNNGSFVPLTSLKGTENNGFSVFVIKEDNTLEMRSVTVGNINEKGALVVAGLSSGERIVSTAVSKMRNGMEVKEYQGSI